MSGQTDHERARIIEAHDTIAQEAYWGDGDATDDDDNQEGTTMPNVTGEWIMKRSEDCGRGNGLMAAYDTLKDRLTYEDRMLLLKMAARAFAGHAGESK